MFRSIRLIGEANMGLRSLAFGMAVALAGLTALASPAAAQDPIRLGGEVQGRFQDGDAQLTSGEYVDVYVFEGRAGQQVTVQMSSSDVDSYVMIRGPSGFTEFNDDRDDGDVDSRLTVRLPANGQYRIQATTFAPGESGRYTLSLLEGAGPTISAQGGGRAQDGTANAGQLSTSDDAISSGEYADSWSFTGTPGQTYVVRLNSAEFDPYLMVRGDGVEEDNDDDQTGRGSRNSRIEFIMPDAGEVSIITTSYEVGEMGAYTLVLEEAGGTTAVASAGGSTVRPGQAVTGRLDVGNDTLRSGEYMTVYTLNGQAGDHIELTLRSDQFDPYLFVQGPGDFAVANDDDDTGEDGVNSRLVLTLPASGEYQIVATSYAPGETGTYRLSVTNSDAGSVETAVSPRAGNSFADGVSLSGMLSASDEQLTTGEYADRYVISGQRGDRVALDLQSDAFDTYLFLRGPDDVSADNDDGPNGTNSRIDMTLPADGDYTVSVTSFQPGEVGPYSLTAGLSMGTPRQAGVQGGPRVFAIMVGISDYGGYSSDLAYTADDALKLAEDLRREGVLNPSSVVLTDADATVGGVRRAFAEVAAQAGPDDIFLFFFSGHGSQQSVAVSGNELDGLTETIVLRDGQITDTEMAELFATLDTRLSLIVLDSCFSGGFARNVVNRPGVIGLFSSEEDLTSQVAVKFQAGGYLSHFLRSGLTGEANYDGDDLITAGELTTYLRRQFAAEVMDVQTQTMDGQRSYQHLVVERGGVQVDDVVIRIGRG